MRATRDRHLLATSLAAGDAKLGDRHGSADTVARLGNNSPVPTSIPDSFTEMAERVSDWGRWGPDDRIGTINLIDGAARGT